MKYLFACIICVFFYSQGFSQKRTAKEYFNDGSRLYLAENKEDALITVQRGMELYENDTLLPKLYDLIKGEDDKNKQKNQQNQQNQDGGDQGQDQQNQSGSGSDGGNNSKDKKDNSQNQDGSQNQGDKGESDKNKDSKQSDKTEGESKEQTDKQEANGQQNKEKIDQSQGDDAGAANTNDAEGKEQQRGQISTVEAEMMLQNVENSDKAIQKRVQQQKNQNAKRYKTEKDW